MIVRTQHGSRYCWLILEFKSKIPKRANSAVSQEATRTRSNAAQLELRSTSNMDSCTKPSTRPPSPSHCVTSQPCLEIVQDLFLSSLATLATSSKSTTIRRMRTATFATHLSRAANARQLTATSKRTSTLSTTSAATMQASPTIKDSFSRQSSISPSTAPFPSLSTCQTRMKSTFPRAPTPVSRVKSRQI